MKSPFEPLPTGFNPVLALELAAGSRAVYDLPQYSLQAYLDAKKFRYPGMKYGTVADGMTDSFALWMVIDGVLHIIFRGTRSLKNALEDMDVRMVRPGLREFSIGRPGLKIHQGFHEATMALWQGGLREAVREYMFRVESTDGSASRPYLPYRIVISGHSLGAAEAAVCAAFIYEEFRLHAVGYTFGQPQVGNRAWRAAFEQTFPFWYRMIHSNDIVCRIPRLLWFYVQTKTDMFFEFNDRLFVDLHWWLKLPADIRGLCRHRWLNMEVLLEDHHVQNYCDVLERKWGAGKLGVGSGE